MNRLHHIRETLPKNITDNISYKNLEFVVLNYNSKDGLDEWINAEMSGYIQQGILKYFTTKEPNSFLRSHSKNVAAKQATGDIICNVDADNFIGNGFAQYVNNVFCNNQNCYAAVDRKKTSADFYGRICLRKEDFWKINGYDESMVGYGFEDYDLWNRLEMIGRKAFYIDDPKYLKSVEHGDDERIENESNTKDIFKIYIHYLNHAVSELLYLFKNKKFYLGKVVINKLYNSESIDNLFQNKNFEHYNSLLNNSWLQGEWKKTPDKIILEDESGCTIELVLTDKKSLIKKTKHRTITEYFEIEKKSQLSELIMFFSQINNRIIMEKNKKHKIIKVNGDSFGNASLI